LAQAAAVGAYFNAVVCAGSRQTKYHRFNAAVSARGLPPFLEM
jgi:hypothetical protein